MKRKINILKDYNTQNRKIEFSIVLPCLIVDNDEEIEKIVKRMKKENMTIDQFKKSVAGGFTVGTVDDIMNGISQYANIGVTHFIFHFLHLDQRVLKKFSRIIRVASSKNNMIASI